MSLGGMEALLGFRPVGEIASALHMYPELRLVCETPQEHGQLPLAGAQSDWLAARFSRLMRAEGSVLAEATAAHRKRVEESETNPFFRLFAELLDQFGDRDPGIFCGYFLNTISLPQGRAVFLGPNEPHAYLRGPILECMASSDNVIRAGLTNKFRDVETLLSMLHYRTAPPEFLTPLPRGPGVEEFPVPVPDFAVRQLFVPGKLALRDHDRPSIVVGIGGTKPRQSEATDIVIENGSVFFLPGDLAARHIEPVLSASPDTKVFQATVGRSFAQSA